MDRIKIDDLQLRPDVAAARLERAGQLRETIDAGMPDLDKAVAKLRSRPVLRPGPEPGPLAAGPATPSTWTKEPAACANATAEHVRPMLPAGPPADRGGHARRRGQLAQGRQLRQPLLGRAQRVAGPHARRSPPRCSTAALAALIDDLDERGLLSETLVVAVGEFGRSPQRGVSTSGNGNNDDGRDHWPYCYTAVIAGGRHPPGLRLRPVRHHRLGPARQPGPSDRPAGHDLPQRRPRPAHDRLQPSQPAAQMVKGEPITALFG